MNSDKNESIILLGMPGSGKTTLAVMLSVAFNWPIRESAQFLKSRFGQTPETYKKDVGADVYQTRLEHAVKDLLSENQKKCVIVCDITAVQGGISLLRDFSKTHIVIHIERDIQGIAEHMQSWDREKIEQLQKLTVALFRSCSNLEYYNVTEKTAHNQMSQPISHALHAELDPKRHSNTSMLPSLNLKSVERDFIRFACAAREVGNSMAWDISSPIYGTLTEKRTYTYVVSVALQDTLNADIEDIATAADAFEIVIDAGVELSTTQLTEIGFAYGRVRRRTTLPVILHVLRNRDDPKSHETHRRLFFHCQKLLPDYITIDLAWSKDVISKQIERKGQIKTIGHLNLSKHRIKSWHDSACLDIYNKAKDLGLDVVRLCLTPRTMDDNFAIISFRNYVDHLPPPCPPLIAYNTGLLGRTSLCLNSAMTPVMAQGLSRYPNDEEAPSIIAAESTAALFELYVHVPLKFWFAASKVGHTLSPAMHNAAFKAFGIPHTYQKYECHSLSSLSDLIRSSSFGGISLGPPFKSEAIKIVQSLSQQAQIIGAINTIIPARRKVLSDTSIRRSTNVHLGAFQGVDALHGDNTDWIGIAITILRGLSPVNAIRSKSSALVIGAGSMARAAIFSLLSLGMQNIFLFNRTRQHAEELANHYRNLDKKLAQSCNITNECLENLRISVVPLLTDTIPERFASPSVVISCIPVIEDFRIPDHWLINSTGGVVLDLSYESFVTSIADQIWSLSHKGWILLRGFDFLPEQGCPQFELFTGRRAPRRLMRTEVLMAWREQLSIPSSSAL